MNNDHLLNVYNRSPITITKGKGVYLYDNTDKQYLDFASGIATTGLGHCHPYLIDSLNKQSQLLWHCSNLVSNFEQQKLASRLSTLTFADKVFFCSSGLETTETAIKIIRRYHYVNGEKARNTIITINGGFHGRSMAAISAGGNDYVREGYAPLLGGFKSIPKNDFVALKKAVDHNTAGIFLELIQSEGGVYALDIDYLHHIREFTKEQGIILAFDEVQTGYGRICDFFYHQQIGIEPDILTCAKAMGNGFPVAACLTKEFIADTMKPGTHGSTYGGNPLAMAVGNAVLDIITKPDFFNQVRSVSKYLHESLQTIQTQFPNLVKEIRGKGLLIGIEFHPQLSLSEIINLFYKNGLIVSKTANKNTIRLLPPLIIQKNHVDQFIDIFSSALNAQS